MTTEQDRNVIQAFVVEDNPIDVALLRFALQQEATWPVEMTVVEDGERAISRLLDVSKDKPDLVILDLNLPRRDGTEVLQAIRGTPALRNLPVAILSSSPGDVIQDKLTAAGVLADAHFTKSTQFDDFLLLGGVLREWYEKQTSARESSNN
jgi:two-component system, chemotaxis family, response regulator Rcp1